MIRISRLLLGIILGTVSFTAEAQPVYLVELANFACPHCRHMEDYIPQIEKAVNSTGGVFDFAPVAADKQTNAPAQVYFAAREQGSSIADETRKLLFEAMGTDGMPIEDPSQGIVFLQQDWPATVPGPNYTQMIQAVSTKPVKQAVAKALEMGDEMGVSRLPAFIFVRDGQPVGLLARGGRYPHMAALAHAVLVAIPLYAKGAVLPPDTAPTASSTDH